MKVLLLAFSLLQQHLSVFIRDMLPQSTDRNSPNHHGTLAFSGVDQSACAELDVAVMGDNGWV